MMADGYGTIATKDADLHSTAPLCDDKNDDAKGNQNSELLPTKKVEQEQQCPALHSLRFGLILFMMMMIVVVVVLVVLCIASSDCKDTMSTDGFGSNNSSNNNNNNRVSIEPLSGSFHNDGDQTTITTTAAEAANTDQEPCKDPIQAVEVTGHTNGTIIDTGESGTGTGFFSLFGVAPPDTTRIRMKFSCCTDHDDEEGDEGRELQVNIIGHDNCRVWWTVQVHGDLCQGNNNNQVNSTIAFRVEALARDSSGDVVELTVLPPADDDVLLGPAFVNTPQLRDRLLSFDPKQGVLVFEGDVAQILKPGDGLFSNGTTTNIAPDGYLLIVIGTELNTTNTTVFTRPSGLDEFYSQVDIDYDHSAKTENPSSSTSSTEVVLQTLGVERRNDNDNNRRELIDIQLGGGGGVVLKLNPTATPGKKFKLKIRRHKIQEFHVELSMVLSLNVELLSSSSSNNSSSSHATGNLPGISVTLSPLPLPRVISHKALSLEIEAIPFYEVDIIDGKLNVGYHPTLTARIGYELNQGAYSTVTPEDFEQLDIDGSIDLDSKLGFGVNVGADLIVLGEKLVNFGIQPELRFAAKTNRQTCEIDWDFDLVTMSQLDIGASIFGKEVLHVDKNFTNTRDLASGTIELPSDLMGDDPLLLRQQCILLR